MADWAILGGIGKGVTEGLDDKRKADEAAQQKKLRQYQIEQLESDSANRKAVKALPKVGAATYNKSFEKAGAGKDQARAIDDQTREFGSSGAQLTLDALAGPGKKGIDAKSTPYTGSQRSKDMADIHAADNPELSMKLEDRAEKLGQQEYSNKVMELARTGALLPLNELVKRGTELHTSADHPTNSFVLNEDGGFPTVMVFNAKTGEQQRVPITSHEQAINLMLASASPERWAAYQKEQRDNIALGISGYNAGSTRTGSQASMKNAESEASKVSSMISAKLFESQADENRAKAKLYPAQAEHYRAQNKLIAAQEKMINDELNSITGKMSPNEKLYLKTISDHAAQAAKLAAENPTSPEVVAQSKAREFTLASYLKSKGLSQIDPYAYAQLPHPQIAANNVIEKNKTPAEIDQARQNMLVYGMDYATQVSAELDKAIAKKQAADSKKATSNSIGEPARGIVTGGPAPGSPASRFMSASEAALENNKPGHIPGLVDIVKNLR